LNITSESATEPVVGEKNMADRWKDLSRRIELWCEIHELNEQGFYSPVELLQREGQEAGGVFMLRQGYSRRIVVQCLAPRHGQNGNLPVVIESISNVAVGSVTVRTKTQKGLDSYQERDLQTLRDRFSNSVMKRREYLDHQIQEMINKPNKTQDDKEHEGMLIDQWVTLTEERNAILCPSTGSGVPGATMDWNPLPGMENHIPVIFLDLDDNALSGCADIDIEPAGYNSYLSFEQSDSIIGLPILKYDQKRVTATASWDSSIHDSVYLNRVTQNTERVYVILKITLRLSSPALVNVVLRKRICVRMYKRPSLKDSLRKKFWRSTNVPTRCGSAYELISHIPRQSGEQTEERETLAQKAANAIQTVGNDGEELMDGDAIEKYNKGISHVENILTLHKLRQEVLVKEKLAAVGRSSKSLQQRNNMRKFASTPNLFNAPSLSNIWRSNNYPSNTDLNNSELQGPPSDPANGQYGRRSLEPRQPRASLGTDFLRPKHKKVASQLSNENRHSFYGFENRPGVSGNDSPRLIAGNDSPRLISREIDIEDKKSPSPPLPRTEVTPPPLLLNKSLNITHSNSTPVKLANLGTLVEDDGPSSPHSPNKKTGFSSLNDINVNATTDFSIDSLVESKKVSLSDLPADEIEQANLDRDRLIRQESFRKTKNLPLTDQGVNNDEEKTEKERSDSSPPALLKVGDVVKVSADMEGQVRFYGRTQFAEGVWVGMALNDPKGKNDGSVNGVSYFKCEPLHGLFIRADKLSKS